MIKNNFVFYYGVMGCSKSANALMQRFQFIEKGKSVWLIKPAVDTRDDSFINNKRIAIIKSRIGISAEADIIYTDDNLIDLHKLKSPDIIICDEAQFLTASQVDQLRTIVSYYNIPVFCYGLRTDFQSNLFEGSKRLFELADTLCELDAVCECGEHAIINARLDKNGQIIKSGQQIELGGNELYTPVCWNCWNKKVEN